MRVTSVFGPVFFCTYEEYKPLINLSGSPQGHQRFDVLATPCSVHAAHCHRTHVASHAEAFTLLKSYHSSHPSINSAAIIPLHSSIIRHTHSHLLHSSIIVYTVLVCASARDYASLCVRALTCMLSLSSISTFACAPVFLHFQQALSDGGPSGRWGMDLRSKEFSKVNIIT